jgi:hypothetical protein
MHFKLLVVAAAAGFIMALPAPAAAACCDQHASHAAKAPCCDMPCCKDQAAKEMPCCGEKDAAAVLLSGMTQDPQLAPAPPAKQMTEIWFKQPTLVGRSILQGRYVIEHDNDRMARGEPCTHIYAFDDRTKPVVAFHCTHLERGRATENIAVIVSTGDPALKRFTEFQFAGETAAHGYPIR